MTACDGVAVIGLSCRLPGAATTDAFWRLLREGGDAVSDAPADRWPAQPSSGGPAYPGRGGFLDHVDRFDPGFFGISPREAAAMDPRQRLMLELGWEAIEDAGLLPARLGTGSTGVFVGSIGDDYAALLRRHGSAAVTRHTLTGLQPGLIANRISYALGLHGPSMTIDAAQASSLVAVHTACRSLRDGESTVALAGGVNLILAPESTVGTTMFGGLSPDGRCYTFDSRANGYVRGEGGGFVVLKPLAQALADGDPVYCVIRGGAVNNDGATDGLTVPSPRYQEEVLRRACEQSGVRPADIQYVELHGTGTAVGDPVEAAALGAALGSARPEGSPLPVGSVKTNIGHLEGAAGIAGLIKTALSIRHRILPPSLNFAAPNPAIPLAELNLRVHTEPGPWPGAGRAPLAGVSSFGMGGTNCHLVVSAPPEAPEPAAQPLRPVPEVLPLPVSGHTADALRAQADRLRRHLNDDPGIDTADLAYSGATTRTPHAHRAVVLAGDRAGFAAGLGAVAEGAPAPNTVRGTAGDPPATAVLFTGQGAQRVGMGDDLARSFPVFARALDEVCAHFDPYLERPLREVMSGDSDALDRTGFTQPALFAFEVALFRLFETWGAAPDHVAGHSLGELSAAHIAGVLSLSDAAAVVAARGRLMQALPPGGEMLAVTLGEEDVRAALSGMEDRADIAALNGPAATVVSGDSDAIAELGAVFARNGADTRRLRVGAAFHSPRMDAVLDEFRDVVERVALHPPRIPMISNVTGLPADDEVCSPEYWVRHVRRPVRFADGIAALRRAGVSVFVELGPDSVLTPMASTGSGGADTLIAAVRRNRSETEGVVTALGRLHTAGVPVDWAGFYSGMGLRRTALPGYPFQRSRYWLDDLGPRISAGAEPETTPAAAPSPPGGEPGGGPAAAQLAEHLAGLPSSEREHALLDLVRAYTADVLGHTTAEEVGADRPFTELGLDSLGAVELRDRLYEPTGLRLPPGLVFDHPTPAALARHLAEETAGDSAPASAKAVAALRSEVSAEPVAIVGIGCRYPGGVASADDLWTLLTSETDAIGEFPTDRGWDLGALTGDGTAGTSYVHRGGFLDGAGDFDADFFGISPREALAMDPQQRLLLETSWEAIEHARIDPTTLRTTPTGVFVGAMAQEYGPALHRYPAELAGFALTGASASVLSGRIAYTLGLEGPAVTIDTACSSSLVSLHLAVRALRNGECSVALAGGAAVMTAPGMFTEFSRQQGLAPDGRIKPFAAAADGTAWAEGAGMLLLQRLSDAREQGRRVLAVIRGSAINQDGASNGLTAPNGPSQQRVIRAALHDARIDPDQVDAVEAHGTGTRLGDPIEAHALLAAYGHHRPARRPLQLGSLKSTLGHTQAAAGVGGVIKMVMAIRHGTLPKTLHIDEPTPHVDWSTGTLALTTRTTPWPQTTHPRTAAVSSFGISGTNAHLILQQATSDAPDAAPADDRRAFEGPVPFVLSAKDPAALRARADRLHRHISTRPRLHPADIAYSLATTRTHFDHRATITATDRTTLLTGLRALADGDDHGTRAPAAPPRPVFVFPGQGPQWQGMALELLDTTPAFAAHLRRCEEALAPHTGWSLIAALRGGTGAPPLSRTDVAQPALFATLVALARLWTDHGVRPCAVVGHSQGEIAAAHIAGAVSLDDAAKIIALRSQALTAYGAHGTMASIALTVDAVRTRLESWPGRLHIAAVNSPRSVVVSGDTEAVTELLKACGDDGIRAKVLPVDYASHSPQVDGIGDRLRADLADITPRPAEVPFYSTVRGRRIDGTELTADYWYRNLRDPVLFDDAVRALDTAGFTTYIEVGPHPALSDAIEQTLETESAGPAVLHTLQRDHAGPDRFAAALAHAYTCGIPLDWAALYPGAHPVDLPGYPFQRSRYWLADTAGDAEAHHPILTTAVPLAERDQWLFSGRVSLQSHRWLADHAITGTPLLPGTAFLEMAVHAGRHIDCPEVAELVLHTPLVVPQDGREAVLNLEVAEPDSEGRRTFGVHARIEAEDDEGSAWSRLATGVLQAAGKEQPPDQHTWPPAGAAPADVADAYARLAERGYDYGPAFRGLRSMWTRGSAVFAEVELPENSPSTGFALHPAVLDAALHAVIAAGATEEGTESLRLPFAWSGVRIHGSAASVRVEAAPEGRDSVRLRLTDATGAAVATVASLVLRDVPPDGLAGGTGGHRDLYTVTWSPAPDRAAPSGPATRWAVVGTGVPDVAPALAAAGAAVQTFPGTDALVAAVGPGSPPPDIAVIPVVHPSSDPAAASEDARTAVRRTLPQVRDLASGAHGPGTLVVLTRGAVAAHPGEAVGDLAAAPVWGLLRSAQSEQPGRFVLVDTDDSTASLRALPSALASGEPQVAVRDGRILLPRLSRAPGGTAAPTAFDADGTVLVTGATGTLGRLLARHLVARHGVRHLLLTSRRGADAPGTDALRADLSALGAGVTFTACDVADRDALAELISSVPGDRPLTGVVHAAGVLDDATFDALTPGQIDAVFGPKADAAAHLHDLTRDHDLTAFVLFSSVAGTLGTSGQANYAAANTYLDALAHHRRHHGLPALSLAWGLWHETSGMTGHLGDAELARMARSGVLPMSTDHGLALFDAALRHDEPVLVAAHLAARPGRGESGPPSPLLRGPAAAAETPPERNGTSGLAELPEAERHRTLLRLVRTHAATLLGKGSAEEVPSDQPFSDMGVDSLIALELRNGLKSATGLDLASGLLFDHPTPLALVQHLDGLLRPAAVHPGAEADDAEIRTRLQSIPVERIREEGLLDALLALTGPDTERDRDPGARAGPGPGEDALDSMAVDDLVNLALETDASPRTSDSGD